MADKIETSPLPCPFCGGIKLVNDQFRADGGGYAVSCEDDACFVIGPQRETKEAAVAAWNKPAREPAT